MNDLTNFQVADAFKHLKPTQSLGEGISSGFTSIGYKDMKWALKHEGTTQLFVQATGTLSPHLDVIIIAMNDHISKMYYGGTYVDGSNNAPICASAQGDKPDPGVPEPQNPTCAGCPNNEWGSGQGKGKACKDHRRLAVLILPYMTKGILEKPLKEPVYFAVNPNSLKALKAYGDSLQHRGIHFATCITRITWSVKTRWLMEFKLLQMLTNAEAPVVLPLLDSPVTKNIINVKSGVYEDEQEPPPPRTQQQQPVSTGLMEAFGNPATPNMPGHKIINATAAPAAPEQAPAKRGPGRPRKALPQQQAAPTEPAQENEEASNGGDVTPPWDEDDPDLSDAVTKLTADKMKGMMR